MKPLQILGGWSRICLVLIALMSSAFSNVSSANPKPLKDKSYVVIGAFSFEKNAQRYKSFATEKELSAQYEINPSRNLFYVYVFVSVEKNLADRELFRIRSMHPEFGDAWVYEGKLGGVPNGSSEEQPENIVSGSDNNANEQSMETKLDTRQADEEIAEVGTANTAPGEPIQEKANADASMQPKAEKVTAESATPALNKAEGVHHFYFNLLNSKRLKEVKGRVKIIDAERAKQLMVAKSHEIVDVREPNNGSNRIKVASDIFGFKEVQYTIDLDNPVNDSTSAFIDTIGDSIIVNFELERYKKGDVLVMYNVYFFRDAAIMKNESLYELNSLLDMLQENEKYKVRIHGHTNGNSHGKIIHLDPEDKNFFSLNANHQEDNGSAKKLSLYRAYTIQHWLMDQGIAEERMEIKGWGGRKMIYDKHDTQADKNVRVEIEITADQ